MRSRIFLLALVLMAMPLHAQTVRLYCADKGPANNLLVEVNYAARTVAWGGGGAASLGPVQANISEYEISWAGVGSAQGIFYRVSRVNGKLTACDKAGCWPESSCQKADEIQRKF